MARIFLCHANEDKPLTLHSVSGIIHRLWLFLLACERIHRGGSERTATSPSMQG